MEGVNPPKYTKAEVSQKFNLKKILGYDPTEEQKELFYELVVDKMVDRTLKGQDINGKDFEIYSKEYAEKKGVTRDSVDLVMEGDMLNSFDQSVERKNIIKVAVGKGVDTLKAFNHCTGDTLPVRNFFGIVKDNEIRRIAKEVNKIKPKERPRLDATEERLSLADIRRAIEEEIDITIEGFNGKS